MIDFPLEWPFLAPLVYPILGGHTLVCWSTTIVGLNQHFCWLHPNSFFHSTSFWVSFFAAQFCWFNGSTPQFLLVQTTLFGQESYSSIGSQCLSTKSSQCLVKLNLQTKSWDDSCQHGDDSYQHHPTSSPSFQSSPILSLEYSTVIQFMIPIVINIIQHQLTSSPSSVCHPQPRFRQRGRVLQGHRATGCMTWKLRWKKYGMTMELWIIYG